jgi:hypothetical protein
VSLAKAMPDPSLAKTIIRVEMNPVKASFKRRAESTHGSGLWKCF